ncbi:hypothetical protein EDC04DRAFT_2891343 [Pisolithus marmoratus]|nr:hypothetical protein EDC04DRAFT_2891343 [Pisolithus marmoratus]
MDLLLLPSLSPLDDLFVDGYYLALPPPPDLISPSSPSASDTSSSLSTGISSSPEPVCGPKPTHTSVCDVPLLAPRPLPYHSPTFLRFDLPDQDEDLSHPPYTHRPPKRKRSDDEHCATDDIHYDLPAPPPTKRRARIHAWRSRVHREQPVPLQQLPSQQLQQHYTCPSGGVTTLDILSDIQIRAARDLGLSIDIRDVLEWR